MFCDSWPWKSKLECFVPFSAIRRLQACYNRQKDCCERSSLIRNDKRVESVETLGLCNKTFYGRN